MRNSRHRWTPFVPSIGLAVLSKFTCSFCVAAYAGVLSTAGLGFAGTDRGFTVLTGALLTLGALSLWWSARRHRHSGPLALALGGSVVLLVGRMTLTTRLLYAGAAAVFLGSLWNLWLSRDPKQDVVQLGRG